MIMINSASSAGPPPPSNRNGNALEGVRELVNLFNQVMTRKLDLRDVYKLLRPNKGTYDYDIYQSAFRYSSFFSTLTRGESMPSAKLYRYFTANYGVNLAPGDFVDKNMLFGFDKRHYSSSYATLPITNKQMDGLWELKYNYVDTFINKMIARMERYVPENYQAAYPEYAQFFNRRSSSGVEGTPDIGVPYSYGGKNTIENYVATISNGVCECGYSRGNVPTSYKGWLNESCVPDSGGNIKWSGLFADDEWWSKYHCDHPTEKHPCECKSGNTCKDQYYYQYWLGIDCSGFVYDGINNTMNTGIFLNIANILSRDAFDDFNVSDFIANEYTYKMGRALSKSSSGYNNLPNWEFYIKRGDIFMGDGHIWTMYDEDTTSAADYQIIHAAGGFLIDDGVNPPHFDRKVIRHNISDVSKKQKGNRNLVMKPPYIGRIILWE